MEIKMEIKPRQLEIIEAAGKLLTKAGVSGLTIKNLAVEMNFSESAIYRHFTSKEEIILTLLQYLQENVARMMKNEPRSGDFKKEFYSLFKRLTRYFKENPYYVMVVFSEGLLDESAPISEKIIQLMDTLTQHVQSLVEDGQKMQLITGFLTSEQITQIIIPAFRHQMFKWKVTNFESDIDYKIESLFLSLMELLKVHKK
ncbi:MAG TPA: TetR/AcrR family transcriptional regulator [Porphyromonadaceae bacterium]|nr:TetR/AcrR family transcriptional regulator [Porphyromonadaceae bacterium]MDD4632416.1 TetR/AcrR family transcriptional regulator [Proteiniphilum sp.]HAR39519.1 TetR/AcrR family transcriptional regulator [Porphyromonadaceae bacterium]HBA99635.1 TetR/AcrR family transcriptional regulator [Porphyromonadaceae bacterium]